MGGHGGGVDLAFVAWGAWLQDKVELQEKLRSFHNNLEAKSEELAREADRCREYEKTLREKQDEWEGHKDMLEKKNEELEGELHMSTRQLKTIEEEK